MRKIKTNICCFLLAVIGLSSCSTTGNIHSFEVELMKPAIFTMPKQIDTIAVFNRNLYRSDTITQKNYESEFGQTESEKALQFRTLSNKCVEGLAGCLKKDGYFLKVINYKDSINHQITGIDTLINYPQLFEKLKVDACIFLDFFKLEDHLSNYYTYSYYYSPLPEFKKSKKVNRVNARLVWTVAIKGDTAQYVCRQPDDLDYGDSKNPEFFGNKANHERMLENSSLYLGNSFGTKLLPSMISVFRTYYPSHNTNMHLAEEYLLNGEFLKAAEIYNKLTLNKNHNIAAKASFNMALVCEMEGHIDAAIEWMVTSYGIFKNKNPEHQFNCEQYITLLSKRKKELELLEKQVR